jgi:hypothetical protein
MNKPLAFLLILAIVVVIYIIALSVHLKKIVSLFFQVSEMKEISGLPLAFPWGTKANR